MKNLVERLNAEGLTNEQSAKSLLIVLDWAKEQYPVLAVLAENKIRSEVDAALLHKETLPT